MRGVTEDTLPDLPSVFSRSSSLIEVGDCENIELKKAKPYGNQTSDDFVSKAASSRDLTEEEVKSVAESIINKHGNDPNFPSEALEKAERFLNYELDALKTNEYEYMRIFEEMKTEAAYILFDSPYPEVRAVTDNYDDPTLPVNTFRVWSIGLIFVAIGSFVNQFFEIRQPGIGLGLSVAQLLAYPVGKFFEYSLPTTEFVTFGWRWSLNPGPFNIKEHMLITIMANCGWGSPYTNYIVWVQYLDRFFGQKWASNFGYQILIGLSTNFIGYGLAGLTRRFLVYPAQAIWPISLPSIALNKIFHSNENEVANGWRVSRMRYFIYCLAVMFVYYWFPGYLIQAMSFFNWITWINPTSVTIAAMTGSIRGLGLNPLPTFDWNFLGYDPLASPFFATVHLFLGGLATALIILAIWFNNVWNTSYLPINSNEIYDNTGYFYNVSLIVDANAQFDKTIYEEYSPAYLTAGNIMIYGVSFATYTATIMHIALYHRRDIVDGVRSILGRESRSFSSDIHMRLMRKYKEVPEWMYFCVLVISIALGAAGVAAFPTDTSPAVVFYGIFLAIIFVVPLGLMNSITGSSIELNILAEVFGGLWFPGNATAMNFFKSYGFITTAQAIGFASDLKLAHYVHIPPRVTFAVQMVATAVSTFVTVGILNFQMTKIPDVCDPLQKDHFSCPGENTFFTASVLWGTLGPKRMFGSGAIYNGLLWCFLIGLLLPLPFYLLSRRFRILKMVNIPVFLSGGLIWGAYNMAYVWPVVPIACLFNFYVKRRYLAWWTKYNYITSTAFSSAIAVCAILIYFALQYKDIAINWSGNLIPFEGCDADGCPLLPIPEQGFFGPESQFLSDFSVVVSHHHT